MIMHSIEIRLSYHDWSQAGSNGHYGSQGGWGSFCTVYSTDDDHIVKLLGCAPGGV